MLVASGLLLLLGWSGGAGQAYDVAAIRAGAEWRLMHPRATGAVILYTHLGSAVALLSMTAAGAIFLWWKRERARAAALLGAVLGTRIGVELLKLLVDRSRPSLDAHPVAVFSQSFPSGHAGNGMATFLALALFVAPERWRRPAVAMALVAALAMGVTRPLLGVHWPSDVAGGWTFGATVVALAAWWLRSRGNRSAA
ncbi:phosphatase PAP2 family protein [Sphingomonas sp. LHG3406-1]|uniref:phosphatase PAP2 family protein n=1 Tax=Sphingomonas sp. LHG3406-1 TaxID=2804617 RepID=UPI002633A67C|nr:phosphatase PAP2 family protein [Sphingomonas sp. LHG3406-1]